MRFEPTLNLILTKATRASKATATSLLLVGLLVSTSVSANDTASKKASNEAGNRAQGRAEYHAAQDPGVDAAVTAIVRELTAVGSGPRDARPSNPALGIGRSMLVSPATRGGLGSPAADAAAELADEAAAALELPGGPDEGDDDHAM